MSSMLSRTGVAAVLLTFAASPLCPAQYALNSEQKQVAFAWLAKHPGFRMATDSDCSCDEDLRKMRTEGYGGRWKPVPGYHPYVVAADLNGDGQIDLAIAMVNTKAANKFTMLVFNGPLKPNEPPSFVGTDLSMSGIGFFFGPPRPKPYRLVVGAFESEGYVLVPKGKTYLLDPVSSENE